MTSQAHRGSIAVVAVAVIWQGVGSSVVGNTTAPRLAPAVIAVAFLGAAAIGLAARACGPAITRRASPVALCALNAYSAGAFVLFYLSTTVALPTAASVIETSMAPVILGSAQLRSATRSRWKVGALCAYIAAVLMSILLVTGDRGTDPGAAAVGCVLATLAGLCALGVLTTTRRLASQGCTTIYINSVRFHGCWIAATVLLAVTRGGPPADTASPALIVLVALSCVTAPIMMLQFGITRSPVRASAGVIALLPGMVLITDMAFGAAELAALGPVLCVAIGTALSMPRRAGASADADFPSNSTDGRSLAR